MPVMPSPFRYPDKPVQSHHSVLPNLVDGEFLCQFKHDGWRCWIDFESAMSGRPIHISFTSREKNRLVPSSGLIERVTSALNAVAPVPGWGCLLDAELMGKRDGQPEGIVLLDLLATTNIGWIGQRAALDRFERLQKMRPDPSALPIVECRQSGYAAMFEESRRRPGVEGIVLKRIESEFVGSVRKSIDNPRWIKVKWRAGPDGQKEVV